MAIPLGDPRLKPQPPRRPSFVRRTIRGAGWLSSAPWHWSGAQRIARGGAFIADLVHLLRFGPPSEGPRQAKPDGAFDLQAMALLHGLTMSELGDWMAARRRQTARLAYATFALACLFLAGWLWQALSSPWSGARLASTLEFLPVCTLFFLVAFYNSLVNFQIRTGRAASWREYLMTDQAFLPR